MHCVFWVTEDQQKPKSGWKADTIQSIIKQNRNR